MAMFLRYFETAGALLAFGLYATNAVIDGRLGAKMNRDFRTLLVGAFALAMVAAPSIAAAEEILVESPANWRLQNYLSNNVIIWYTGAPGCTTGQISAANASLDDKNRLWSTVLAAKLANRPVGLTYTKVDGSCILTSFWIEN